MAKCSCCKHLKDKKFLFTEEIATDSERFCGAYIPMTNADRIRSMTDEKLADFIEMKQFFALARNGTDGEDYTLEWLKSEVGCE